MEATVDPCPGGPDWTPITPKTGSLFHAETQRDHAAAGGRLRPARRHLEVRIRAENVKTRAFREVPLHGHLIEDGLVD
jgi:hypothetical protein